VCRIALLGVAVEAAMMLAAVRGKWNGWTDET